MPDATVSQELHHHDLKTLPGAFVDLRQLSYYEMLERRDKAATLAQTAEVDAKTGRPVPRDSVNGVIEVKSVLQTLNTWEQAFMFKNCIADHNLTDKNDVPLDLTNPKTLRILNPKVASEIERLIDELNNWEESDVENFPTAATSSLNPENPEQETSLSLASTTD